LLRSRQSFFEVAQRVHDLALDRVTGLVGLQRLLGRNPSLSVMLVVQDRQEFRLAGGNESGRIDPILDPSKQRLQTAQPVAGLNVELAARSGVSPSGRALEICEGWGRDRRRND
jgi:hypothetical protein